ncbi:unnamed protein product [Thlaspi arvense]|uniref:Carbohydrate kinase PfkB domain-containing protein n=1 Tax=Thlaspi arvense TaxID=13288 RepID=A0AAU9T0Q0_THLAR|nr:unnamed protein product [Thlaspi arvense]
MALSLLSPIPPSASLSSFTLSAFSAANNASSSSSSLSPIYSLYHQPKGTLGSSRTATSVFGGFRGSGSLRIDSMAEKRNLGLMVPRNGGGGGGELDDMDEGEIERIGDQDEDDEELIEGHPISSSSPERWDVLGLGQAMVDFSGVVDDGFLKKLDLEKGTRKLINHEERGKVLQAMDGCSYKAAAGGSLSNTLVALARLGCRSISDRPLNVAMAGSIAGDPLGSFYRTKLRRANVNFLSAPIKDGTTGTVIVLTTPDAQRTMLAYQGTSSVVNYDSCLASLISKTNVFVVEGYLFELPDTIRTITKACEEAHRNGALVAVTASDVSCIERHYDDFWDIVGNYADIIFANSDEARAFCHFSAEESPISATRYLSHFVPFVSVTDGINGSYIGVKGEAIYIPPSPCVPVDTCGAGDAYASGILYGILRGVTDLKGMGDLAATIAATVVGQQGTRLRVQDAVELARSHDFRLNSSGVRTDVGS